ncbi:hypothetical protein MMC26_005050 [Xylographa opegraphella]|nr:hypothetical protein [Xylographa opegraphella]
MANMNNAFRACKKKMPLPLNDKPRQVPPPATPLKFPCHEPKELSCYAKSTEIDLLNLYSPIRNPASLQPQHVSALNLKIQRHVSLDQLIPAQYLPSPTWDEIPGLGDKESSSDSASATSRLRNGIPNPGHQQYRSRLKELVCDNEDAYRAINRQTPRPGQSAVRPAHLRRFYIALQIVGEFWDTSLDGPNPAPNNITKAHSSPEDEVVSDKLALSSWQSTDIDRERQLISKHNSTDVAVSQSAGSKESRSKGISETSSDSISRATVPSSVTPLISPNSAVAASGVTPENYSGRRTSTGTMMPAQYRHNLLKEFLEPLLWAFGCRYEMPRTQPHLYVRSLKVPVDLSGVVYCTPNERPSSMVGSLEGPLFGIQGRHVTTFGEEDGHSDLVDLLREVGAMLLIAQERSREGMDEVIPNMDKWFITRPRWGGGTGVAMGEPLGLACEEEVTSRQKQHDDMGKQGEEPPMKKRSQEKRARVMMSREAAKKENIRKSTMPPSSRWDSRIKYMRVGKDVESVFDNIYLISSVNHHLCIVRLLIHPDYMSYLANGGDPLGQPWFKLQMERSRWYDLLSAEDRVEAMRGIWGVLTWLMRAQ